MMRRQSRDRLGIDPDIIDAGHLVALAQHAALSDLLVGYLAEQFRRR